MAIIWETTDRLGRTVVLTDESWEHILTRHADLATLSDEIRDTITFADEVRRDRFYSRRNVHYRYIGSHRKWLRVIVNYRPSERHGWLGEIITAHLGFLRNQSEVLLWPLRNVR